MYLQMTVMLMKLIEDVLSLFRALCPCLFHNRQLFESLTKTNKRKTGFNLAVGGPIVFIYPNRGSSAASVYVKDSRTGRKKKVCTSIPNDSKSELLDCPVVQRVAACFISSAPNSYKFCWKLQRLPWRRARNNLQQKWEQAGLMEIIISSSCSVQKLFFVH